MNWIKIKDDYGNAWGKLNSWIIKTEGEIFSIKGISENGIVLEDGSRTGSGIFFNPRDLYDFFDSNGLNIFIRTASSCVTPCHRHLDKWIFEIGKDKYFDNDIMSKHDSITRTEAETAAFTKAFEILEEKMHQDRADMIIGIINA